MAEFKLHPDSKDKSGGKDTYNKDKRILDICKLLTEKGYVTEHSCEGHADELSILIQDGYVYGDTGAYITFSKPYEFPKPLPSLWKSDSEINKINKTKSDSRLKNIESGSIRYCDTDPLITTTHSLDKQGNISGTNPNTFMEGSFKICKATPQDMKEYKGWTNVNNMSRAKEFIRVFEQRKNKYLGQLKHWADSLPDLSTDDEPLNEAVSKSMSPNAKKRKAITDFVVELYNTLEAGGTKNSDAFLHNTAKMSDAQFIAYFTQLVKDPQMHLYFEMEAFKYEPTYETVEKAALDVVGDEYTHLYDYIAFPHLSPDPKRPQYTVHKVFNGYINMRRVQQLVNNKNHIPTDVDQRDPKTNQVVQHSKAARVSTPEQFGMICQGNKKVLKEMYGPRGGDPVMRDSMIRQISSTGSVQLENMEDSKFNKTSLNTANVYLTGAGLETDLVTKKGILPRTLQKQYKDAKTLSR